MDPLKEELPWLRELHAAVFERSRLLVYVHDLQGNFLEASDAALNLLGYTREEITSLNVASITSEKHIPVVLSTLEEISGTGRERGFRQLELKRKDGSSVWVEAEAALMYRDGRPYAVLGIAWNITGKMETEARFQFLAENTADIVWALDPDLKTTYVSPSVSKVLGFPAEQWQKKPLEQMMTPESLERVLALKLDELEREGDPATDPERHVEIEVEYRHAEGHTVWMSNRVKAHRDPSGNIVGLYGTSHDITDRKRVEKEKLALEAQLHRAQKMESLGTMAGGIGHDFNNILAIISGYTELACLESPSGSRQRANLEQVMQAVARGKDVVSQIVSFSRRSLPERKPLDVVPILRESLKLLQASIPGSIFIRLDLQIASGVVMGDPTEIYQMLFNLCLNAREAMEDTGGMLSIGLYEEVLDSPEGLEYDAELSPGTYLRLTVSDDGRGMDAATQERIFDPYFTTKGPGKGSGLGLAVVHGIVWKHEGAIRVSSEPGKGTRVDVVLPRAASEATR